MSYFFDFDEIYGTEGQEPSVYRPGEKEDLYWDDWDEISVCGIEGQEPSVYCPRKDEEASYWDEIPDVNELAEQMEQEQERKEHREEELDQEDMQQRSSAKTGYFSPAYRRDLDMLVDKMYYLREKGYSYHRIGRELGCSPNTVRSRLNDKQLLRELWLE